MSSAQPLPWYLYPISMRFGALEGNGVSTEKGVDLRVPYHTPITPLFPGTVRSVATGPYGQEVDEIGMLNGQQVTASYVHLDEALVSQGQAVGLGTELGVSGGQNSGGFHPASPAYSSYPHIEFSLWPGGATPYAGRPYDPMQFIEAVQASQGGVLQAGQSGQSTAPSANLLASLGANLSGLFPTQSGTTASAISGGASTSTVQMPFLSSDIASGVASGISGGASGIGATILQALGVSRLTDLLWRVGLLVVALVLIIVVASALTAKATQNIVEGAANSKPAQTVKSVAPFVK